VATQHRDYSTVQYCRTVLYPVISWGGDAQEASWKELLVMDQSVRSVRPLRPLRFCTSHTNSELSPWQTAAPQTPVTNLQSSFPHSPFPHSLFLPPQFNCPCAVLCPCLRYSASKALRPCSVAHSEHILSTFRRSLYLSEFVQLSIYLKVVQFNSNE